MKEYKELAKRHSQSLDELSRKFNLISGVRIFFAIAIALNLYYYFNQGTAFSILPVIVLAVAFLLAVRVHQRVAWQKRLKKALIGINTDEDDYLNKNRAPFENGSEFINPSHPYSFDLDFFGPHSFYHHLNRTATQMGKKKLASTLLAFLTNEKIKENQLAIKELSAKLEWRQEIFAIGKINQDCEESYSDLLIWARKDRSKVSKWLLIASYVTSAVLAIFLVMYFYTPYELFGNLAFLLFLVNLALLGTQTKKINAERITSTETDKILRQYSLILQMIEHEEFESSVLNNLKSQLNYKQTTASTKIEQLSKLFTRLDHVQNLFAGIVNGFYPFHLQTLVGLSTWREECASQVDKWLNVIGEVEALGSLANFAHNNPNYVYPTLNGDQKISFENLGHPLIPKEDRVNNNVSFENQHFFILTGSNMSGKSTFLRTLGINMVLVNIGAPICATKANIHPLPVLVSMRLSDSLNDNESYFLAEVKRLKRIMSALDKETSFVLLDEILRGTNSDDKRTGTIEVIRKMVEKNAIGAIATHDLEVCKTEAEHPERLKNMCFEVEIENNELVFDYQLQEGVCRNKSATFLMEKMGVI